VTTVGYDAWGQFPYCPTVFVVRNIAPNKKTVNVFNVPITFGNTYDVMAIAGVSEADIRNSLLKGSLNTQLRQGEIFIVDSNIDLLQFDPCQEEFLREHGVTVGTNVEPGALGFAFQQGVALLGPKNGMNRVFTTPDSFLNGAFHANDFRIRVYHNGRQVIQTIDYDVGSNGPADFNTVTFKSFIPISTSKLEADYIIRFP